MRTRVLRYDDLAFAVGPNNSTKPAGVPSSSTMNLPVV